MWRRRHHTAGLFVDLTRSGTADELRLYAFADTTGLPSESLVVSVPHSGEPLLREQFRLAVPANADRWVTARARRDDELGPLAPYRVGTSGGAVHMGVEGPQVGGYVSNPESLHVRVDAAPEVLGLRAHGSGGVADLVWQGGIRWAGLLQLLEVEGPAHVTVAAATALADTAFMTVQFVYDYPPVVTVTEPAGRFVPSPSLPLVITCVSPGLTPCAEMVVRLKVDAGPGVFLAQGNDRIDTVVDISAYPGLDGLLRIDATGGAAAVVDHRITMAWSPRLTLLHDFGPGAVVRAVDSTYAIVSDVTGALVRSAHDGTSPVAVLPQPRHYREQVFPVPNRLIVHRWHETQTEAPLYHWTASGGPAAVAAAVPTGSVRVAGGWVLYGVYQSVLYNPATGTVDTVQYQAWSVLSDGRLIGLADDRRHVIRFAADGSGLDTLYSSGSSILSLVSDGENTVIEINDPTGYRVVFIDAAGSATDLGEGSRPTLRAAWVAFERSGTAGSVQVWRRSPAGVLEQVSALSGVNDVQALAADGRLVFRNRASVLAGAGLLHLAVPGQASEPLLAQGAGFAAGALLFADISGGLFLVRTP